MSPPDASDAPDAVFHLDGDVAHPTELARGPWSPHAQHGGAPASLLAGLLERHDPGPATFPARLTVELLRPVPLAPLRVALATIRPGKKVQLVQGSLHAGETEVVRATLLRLREDEVEAAPAGGVVAPLAPLPDETSAPAAFGEGGPGTGWTDHVGFWAAIEMRRVHGEWGRPGPAGMWIRLTVPVVAGEAVSPFQRVAAAADFGNGIAAAFDRARYSCINPDLTITLHRLPVGEWVGLDGATYPERNGVGVAETVLHDTRGRIGRGVQTVLIDEL